jgi:hypothetical protein
MISDADFFCDHPDRTYRLRLATPAEIAVLDPAPAPEHWIYAVTCRYVAGYAIFRTANSPAPGELDDEAAARELWQGLVAMA